MFTGLINGLGEIIGTDSRGKEIRFVLHPLFPLCNVKKGESIAVNGACLTVETFTESSAGQCSSFTVYASAETIRATVLGNLRAGSKVNLERAVAVGERLGGHLVAGHVDCIAKVSSIRRAGESNRIEVRFDDAYSSQIVPKGSVTLDGVSLTVNECGAGWLSVNVIPETQTATTIGAWRPGLEINMETDMIGKYVQSFLQKYSSASTKITFDLLRENGF